MANLTFSPYLLTIPALLLGILAGWYLHTIRQRRLKRPGEQVKELAQSVHDAEAELARLEAQLAHLTQAIATTRRQVQEREEEHIHLLLTLDEKRASVESANSDLQAIHDDFQSCKQQADGLLGDIDKSLDELDVLSRLKKAYLAKSDRLTQQAQWQDSELRMLRQTIKAKTGEIEEAEALLAQRDAELRRLIRQRQQREVDLARARQMLAQRDDELRGLLQQRPPDDVHLIGTGDRIDITPTDSVGTPTDSVVVPPEHVLLVGSGPTLDDEFDDGDDDQEDDLTAIPGLVDFYASQLKAKGIKTFRQLARLNADQIERMFDIPGHYDPDIVAWIAKAREIVARRRAEGKM